MTLKNNREFVFIMPWIIIIIDKIDLEASFKFSFADLKI